jgi:DNA invertase Pin-like site-specific DNA recombinase
MRAVGYVRVSTDEQVTEGISLDAQLARVTAYALLKDWDKLRRRVQETWGTGDLDR